MNTPRALHKQAMKLRIEAGKLDAEAIRIKERERIIKLLEADLCTNSEWDWTDCYGLNKEHCERLKEYIELIKGGTSE